MIKTHDAGKTVTINDSERRKFRVLGQEETGGTFNRMRGQYCVKDACGQVSWKILLLRSHYVWGTCGSSLFVKEMDNCYSRVKMVVNVLIARGDHVYILRARGSQTSWRCWDVSHSVQGIRLSALESKARQAFQAMQAEYRVNFDLRFWQL